MRVFRLVVAVGICSAAALPTVSLADGRPPAEPGASRRTAVRRGRLPEPAERAVDSGHHEASGATFSLPQPSTRTIRRSTPATARALRTIATSTAYGARMIGSPALERQDEEDLLAEDQLASTADAIGTASDVPLVDLVVVLIATTYVQPPLRLSGSSLVEASGGGIEASARLRRVSGHGRTTATGRSSSLHQPEDSQLEAVVEAVDQRPERQPQSRFGNCDRRPLDSHLQDIATSSYVSGPWSLWDPRRRSIGCRDTSCTRSDRHSLATNLREELARPLILPAGLVPLPDPQLRRED